MKKILTAAALLATLSISSLAVSEVLLIDVIAESPPNSPAGLIRPSRGMSMDTVKQRFGEPTEVYSPVGEPPITRWGYQGYSVYFEHDRVITTVVHQ
jgi:hypothetical protein